MKLCTEKLLRLLPLETEPLWLELWSGCRLHPHPPSLPSSCSAEWPCHAWLSWTLRCCSVLHRWAVRFEVQACKGWCHLRGQESFLVLKTCQLLFNITECHVTNIKATCQGECLFPTDLGWNTAKFPFTSSYCEKKAPLTYFDTQPGRWLHQSEADHFCFQTHPPEF